MKAAKFPSITGWINKIWYIHIIEYYLARKSTETCYDMDTNGFGFFFWNDENVLKVRLWWQLHNS
jgi:hypothetical protein